MAPQGKAPQAPQAPAPIKCTMCGKTLATASAQAAGMGGLCAAHVTAGRTPQTIAQHRATLTVAVAPANFISIGALDKVIKAKRHQYPGLTITKMVNAIGRDVGLLPPVHPICQIVYTPNKWRWVNDWLATPAGLKALQTGDFSKAPTQASPFAKAAKK